MFSPSAIKVGLIISLFPAAAFTQSANITVEKLDPNKPLSALMKPTDPCHIVYVNGVPYRVCPYAIPPREVEAIRNLSK
jgi:hypothetical protein